MNDSVLMKCSGVVGKLLDKNSEYNPGVKNFNWIKINKQYYTAELDSLNYLVIGAKYAQDTKTYSAVILACLNEENGNYEAFVLTHGALKFRQLSEITFYLKEYVIPYIPSNYNFGKFQPDVIFAPQVIVNAKSFFVCLNKNSALGYNVISDGYGLSIRFPKIIKIREDKVLSQLCTSERMVYLYRSQDFLKEPEIEYQSEDKSYPKFNNEYSELGDNNSEYTFNN